MRYAHLKVFYGFFLLTPLLVAVTGCGSGSAPANNETGSIATTLKWSPPESKTPGKTLYVTPTGVTTVRLTVSGAGISPDIIANFPATAGVAGKGRIDGVPAGTGRTVKAEGLDKDGILRYKGSVTGIPVTAGALTAAGAITLSAPITTASPAGGNYNSAQSVTLTSNTPATIFYTTNLLNPFINGGSQPTLSIPESTTLYYYALDSGFAQEFTKTEIYTIAVP